jgi:hypothetical protein
MAAKTCGKFCYISYNPESSTVIEGVHDDEIWEKIWDSINDLYSRYTKSGKYTGMILPTRVSNALISCDVP